MPALIRPFDNNDIRSLSKPTGKLCYVDFKYESISENRRKKLDEIFPDLKDEN